MPQIVTTSLNPAIFAERISHPPAHRHLDMIEENNHRSDSALGSSSF